MVTVPPIYGDDWGMLYYSVPILTKCGGFCSTKTGKLAWPTLEIYPLVNIQKAIENGHL